MKKPITFEILKKKTNSKARRGRLITPHGIIETPTLLPVATKATLKGIGAHDWKALGVDAVIANTYHLYLTVGDEIIKKLGGIHSFMNWDGPVSTDSGGFQVFSLGAAFGKNLTKVAKADIDSVAHERRPVFFDPDILSEHGKLAVIDDEGVTFTSHIDGTLHRFTPERSIEIQHNIGADIIFAFDECTSATADHAYQLEAMERTHRWAKRSLSAHRQNTTMGERQALFGIVQGGRFEDLRKESARFFADMDFDGYGIGGSYVKEDLDTAVGWVTDILPEDKPRHLLGIGEPEDIISGIEKGIDLFDCVQPTRLGRTGMIYNAQGEKINLCNERYKHDESPLDETGECELLKGYTKAYVAHLLRSGEMLGGVLCSMSNVFFLERLLRIEREKLDSSV